MTARAKFNLLGDRKCVTVVELAIETWGTPPKKLVGEWLKQYWIPEEGSCDESTQIADPKGGGWDVDKVRIRKIDRD